MELYGAAISRLDGEDLLYPCYCARKEIQAASSALRVRSKSVRISFEDRLLGRHEYEVDDFVVRRNDGTPAYQPAVVADDAAQGIAEAGESPSLDQILSRFDPDLLPTQPTIWDPR
ncbi:MAG: hypothetical protein ACRDSJ_21830 [Rubrobacteraceae bacterium]